VGAGGAECIGEGINNVEAISGGSVALEEMPGTRDGEGEISGARDALEEMPGMRDGEGEISGARDALEETPGT
jgi:hypothetical protein